MKKEKTNKITIYLIKKEVDYDKILKSSIYDNILREDKNSVTYFLPTKKNTPEWLITYFNNEINSNIFNSQAKVISLHKLKFDDEERTFAVTFGSGKSLLEENVIEEQFGIKILLNSVKEDGFRQLNIANYGGDHRTKNEQTPKKTNIEEFGFDIYNDFLRKATAKSDEEKFCNNTITGGDLLSVTVPVTIENIDEFLEFCYRKYQSDKYKEKFSWLDNIKEVKEKGLKQQLNNRLVKEINEKNFERVWMAVPEIINWEEISDFRYTKTKSGSDDIEILDFIKRFKNEQISDVEVIKNRKIYAMGINSDEPLYEWSAYNCLIAEIEYEKNEYCLNYGKWYKVDSSFVNKINDYYEKIPISSLQFPNSVNNEREDEYNEKLNKNLENSILLDKKIIRISGMGRSSIEICDVLTENKELIHVKKNAGSSHLSHLFNQAAVSGEMLLDKRFREEANKTVNQEIFSSPFISSNYTIILAIITKYDTLRPKIPFFSKVAIQYAIDGLIRKGYIVQIKNIQNVYL